MRGEPVEHLFVACGFSVSVGTGAENCDKQMGLFGCAASWAVDRYCRPGPIDKQFLACFVFLAENDILFPAPALVKFAEPAVPVAVRVGFPVLFPKQLQGDEALGLALLMNGRKVRCGFIRFAGSRLRTE
jgi:hypothetical protein